MIRNYHGHHTILLYQRELLELNNRVLFWLQFSRFAELKHAFVKTYIIRIHEEHGFAEWACAPLFHRVAAWTMNQIIEWWSRIVNWNKKGAAPQSLVLATQQEQ